VIGDGDKKAQKECRRDRPYASRNRHPQGAGGIIAQKVERQPRTDSPDAQGHDARRIRKGTRTERDRERSVSGARRLIWDSPQSWLSACRPPRTSVLVIMLIVWLGRPRLENPIGGVRSIVRYVNLGPIGFVFGEGVYGVRIGRCLKLFNSEGRILIEGPKVYVITVKNNGFVFSNAKEFRKLTPEETAELAIRMESMLEGDRG